MVLATSYLAEATQVWAHHPRVDTVLWCALVHLDSTGPRDILHPDVIASVPGVDLLSEVAPKGKK